MSLSTIFALSVSAIVGALVVAYMIKRRATSQAILELIQDQKLGEIREFQEQIALVKSASLQDTQAYKEARKLYVTKYKDIGHGAPGTKLSDDK